MNERESSDFVRADADHLSDSAPESEGMQLTTRSADETARRSRLRRAAPIGILSWKMLVAQSWILLGFVLGGIAGYVLSQASTQFSDTGFVGLSRRTAPWYAAAIGSLIGTFAFGLPITLYLRLKIRHTEKQVKPKDG